MILVSVPAPSTLKLVDFGLARLSDQERNSQKLTSTGELIGSAGYMSPEQCLGKAVDFRTDIYSLTACLYEMLVGKKAMDADSSFGLMYKQLSAPVPIITSTQVDRFHPVLNEIISRGMSKNPQDRYASMDEMSEALDTTITRLQSGMTAGTERLRRLTLGAIASLVLLTLALGGTSYWESHNANHTRSSSIIPTEQERVSQQIVRLKAKVDSWKDPDTIKSLSLQKRHTPMLCSSVSVPGKVYVSEEPPALP
jgi:serine/threonine protein kinase